VTRRRRAPTRGASGRRSRRIPSHRIAPDRLFRRRAPRLLIARSAPPQGVERGPCPP